MHSLGCNLVALSLLSASVVVTSPSTAQVLSRPRHKEAARAPETSVPQAQTEAPRAPDQSVPPTEKADPRDAGRGFILALNVGPSFLLGEAMDGEKLGAAFASSEVLFGAYVTRHIGLLGGVAFGVGVPWAGCKGKCTKAYTYQFPIRAQFAFQDRSRGPYVEGGLALLSTFSARTDKKESPEEVPETLRLSSPVDFTFGAGYRVPLQTRARSTGMCDLRLAFSFGTYTSVNYKMPGLELKGPIADDARATHWTFGFSAGYHFAP